MNLLKIFRVVALLEGLSYILLLFLAVPIKYIWDDPTFVKMLGMPHGILFIVYIIMTFWIRPEMRWNTKQFLMILVASLIPFGTFYIDRRFLRIAN